MAEAKIPENEAERLRALYSYDLLDRDLDVVFDTIIKIAADICDTDISVIALIDRDRQYFLARNGMKPRETPRAVAFCAHAILEPETIFEIPDATNDPRFLDNPLVTGEIGVRFYAAQPLVTPEGLAIGGLCLIGQKPKSLDDLQRDTLRNLGNIIMTLFEARKSALAAAAQLERAHDELEARVEERTRELQDEMAEREALEEQFRQAQKMEAIGQLTGGIAHDFNNLLHTILGNAELLEPELDKKAEELLESMIRAARRGSELTHRLLAFSRRQALRPQSIDLTRVVGGLSGLLARTLGETIELETSTTPRLWMVTADQGQVENAILNLAINARDAMPDGGKLTIECGNAGLDRSYVAQNPEAAVGDYVALAVSDTGIGMSNEVMGHAFEPFFTTKAVGKGTGLGLAMVYGLAKQSGGHVKLYSEEGQGTTVKFYLPRADVTVGLAESEEAEETPRGCGEVVLVIEDNADVRVLVARSLSNLGYGVIDTPDARTALEVLSVDESVDLLLSDVVLPGGMNGPEVAREARERCPTLKVLFMSGYAGEAASLIGQFAPESIVLSKPFQRQELAKALRRALDH